MTARRKIKAFALQRIKILVVEDEHFCARNGMWRYGRPTPPQPRCENLLNWPFRLPGRRFEVSKGTRRCGRRPLKIRLPGRRLEVYHSGSFAPKCYQRICRVYWPLPVGGSRSTENSRAKERKEQNISFSKEKWTIHCSLSLSYRKNSSASKPPVVNFITSSGRGMESFPLSFFYMCFLHRQ